MLREMKQQINAILYHAGIPIPEADKREVYNSDVPGDIHQLVKNYLSKQGIDGQSKTPSECAHVIQKNLLMPFAMTSGDLLTDTITGAINQAVTIGQAYSPSTYRAFCGEAICRDVRDFQDISYCGFGDLRIVKEAYPVEFQNIQAKSEKATVEMRGGRILFSMQNLINNRFDKVVDAAYRTGQAVESSINRSVFEKLVENAETQEDGEAFFSAAHDNLESTGCAPSTSVVAAACGKMAGHTYLDGTKTNVLPAYLAASPGLREKVEITLGNAACVGSYVLALNKGAYARNEILPVYDCNIPEGSWYLFADPRILAAVKVVLMKGFESPKMLIERTHTGEALGVDFQIYMPWGVCLSEWRGAYYNPGA